MDVTGFNHTLDNWIKEVERTNFALLCTKPFPAVWSLGQVSMHLIDATTFYLEQAEICLYSNNNAVEKMSPAAEAMFSNNEIPNELIVGPASNSNTPQPKSKEDLLGNLLALKDNVNRVATLILSSDSKGKTKHPGLKYFNAAEWFQFGEMHFRHHLRQKKRIEELLNSN